MQSPYMQLTSGSRRRIQRDLLPQADIRSVFPVNVHGARDAVHGCTRQRYVCHAHWHLENSWHGRVRCLWLHAYLLSSTTNDGGEVMGLALYPVTFNCQDALAYACRRVQWREGHHYVA